MESEINKFSRECFAFWRCFLRTAVVLLVYICLNMIIHSPVLLKEVLSFVPEHSKLIVDGTL